MLIGLLLNFVANIVSVIFSIIPSVTLADLPLIGGEIEDFLYLMIGYWNTFEGIVPYMALIKDVFVMVILPFEFTLLMIKFFFGSRTPYNG